MRLIPRVFIALALFMLVISYQNFTSVNSSEWDSANTLKIIHEMQDFQKGETTPTSALATPTGGGDLQSVGTSWAQRQGSLLLNGYDKKLESAVNDKLNSWVQELSSDDVSEDLQTSSAEKSDKAENTSTTSKKSKQNLRFARVNSLKYDLGTNSCLDMTADPGNTRFNFSQTLTQRAKVGVEHRTADSQTQMFLKYEW
ncbi:hypothetical protein [Bdellovibrio sp. HCB337]|uniref:hypothetical protein n=1 Tax=Bdellovibrio sp. HCB337 TaxID=3394358 RepID=UPI0039A55C22